MKKNIYEMNDSDLIEIIDYEDNYDSDAFKELLLRAGIDASSEPYVVDGILQIDVDDIYQEAKIKLGL